MLYRETYQSEVPETAFIFKTIYQAACKLNKNRHDTDAWLVINELLSQGFNIDILYNGFSPVGLLAKEGKDQGVDILIKDFNARRSDAIQCYAAAGNKQSVARLLQTPLQNKNYEYLKSAIQGAVLGGQEDLVDFYFNLVKELANKLKQAGEQVPWSLDLPSLKYYYAAFAYAYAGNTDKIKTRDLASDHDEAVMRGYALSGNISAIVNKIPEIHALFTIDSIVYGFEQGGYIENCLRKDDTTILRLFAMCDDKSRASLRQLFRNGNMRVGPPPPPYGPPLDPNVIRNEENLNLFNALITEIENLVEHYHINFSDAYKLYLFKTQYQLTADQAHAWLAPELRVWLLQGIQNTKTSENQRILPDIFFHIAATLAALDDVETKKLFDKMQYSENKRLLINSVEKVLAKESETSQGASQYSAYAQHCRFFDAIKATKNKEQLCDLLDKHDKQDKFCNETIERVRQRL